MKKYLTAALLGAGLMTGQLAAADQQLLKTDHPSEYLVVPGDTLWDISGQFLNSPWRWPQLWQVNKQIANPHLIYPGDIIYLSWVDGKPVLKRRNSPSGTLKLSPKVKRIPLDAAVPTISLKAISSFLEDSLVLDEDMASQVPYVVAGDGERVIMAAGDRAYVRGEVDEQISAQTLYRQRNELLDPKTNELLGFDLQKIADVKVSNIGEQVSSVDIYSSNQEVRVKDIMMPAPELRQHSHFQPQAAPRGLNSSIISVLRGVENIGRFDGVIIALGAEDGIEPGHVFEIDRTGQTVKDPITGETLLLPDENAGVLMVFKSFDRVSYALVMEATRVLSVGDKVRAPQS